MKGNAKENTRLHDSQAVRQCISCRYYYVDEAAQLEKCMRFARFVDHVITDTTRDCSYWTAKPDG